VLLLVLCVLALAVADAKRHHHKKHHGVAHHHKRAHLEIVGEGIEFVQLDSEAEAEEFSAGFGGYQVLPTAAPFPAGAHVVGDGPDAESLPEETNGEPAATPGSAPTEFRSAGFRPPNAVTRQEDHQEAIKMSAGFRDQMMDTAVAGARDAIARLDKANSSQPCNLPFRIAGQMFPRLLSCGGCVSSLTALVAFMRSDLNVASPQMAQYEFSKACLYVEADYVQLCQYMYNVHSRHIISMLFANRAPIHICSCINFCDASDIGVARGAFVASA